jgi:carboxymethylenebutenolidase
MCDDSHKGLVPYTEVNRRQFVALATAGAATAATGIPGLAWSQTGVTERAVSIKTPDGNADASLFLPQKRSAPGVLVWPDINGLRPATADIGRRLAGMGYVALVVNPFYRSGDAAAVAPRGTGQDPAERDRKSAMRALMTDDGVTNDGKTFIAYLDALPETSKAKMGVQGYCMGGPLAFRTAAAMPKRVGAVGSFHGAGLVTTTPNSPHLLIEQSDARYLVAIAKGDDARDPTAKTVLKETFDKAHRIATVEVYGGNHGWCVPDSSAYDRPEAERAWAALTALYKGALV